MADNTMMSDRLARRRQQLSTRLAILAVNRLTLTRQVDVIDEETAGIEARLGEIGQSETDWQAHIDAAKKKPTKQKGK